MKFSKEAKSWIATFLLVIVICLLIVQGLTRLALASADLDPLNVSLSQFGALSYEEPIEANLLELKPLEVAVVAEAQNEIRTLNNTVSDAGPLVLATGVVQIESTSIALPTSTRGRTATFTQTLLPPTATLTLTPTLGERFTEAPSLTTEAPATVSAPTRTRPPNTLTHTPTSTDTATDTPVPPTDTPTDTPIPPTDTPTDTPPPPTDTPTDTPLPPTDTPLPPTDTPTDVPVLPTDTPTDMPIP